jgi:HAD superfamily hydrolase (TIGR01509 family)
MQIRALFFDVGNTLLFPNRPKMLRALHDRGIFPSDDVLRRIERETKREFDDLMQSKAGVDHSFWSIFYTRLLRELDMGEDGVRDDLVMRTRISANWCDVRPGTRETLQALGWKFRMAVISNADGKIAEALAQAGIADCFESITDSGIVGQEKPHPEIFRVALNSLGVGAGESVYVGDVYSVDYVGATGVGMKAVLFDVSGAYKNDGWPRVESLEELEMALEDVNTEP